MTYRTRPALPPGELLGRLSEPDFDPLVESYVEGAPGFVPATDAPTRGEAATLVRDEEAVVELDAALAAPGLVVLADSFYPGWDATVDGVPAPILATNYLFRGVPVPAGHHRVLFTYRPRSVATGAMLSLVGTGILIALFLRPGSSRFRGLL